MQTLALPHSFVDRQGRSLTVRRATEDDAVALLAHVQAVDAESSFLSREPGEFQASVITERMFIKQTQAQTNSIFLLACEGAAIVGSLDFHSGQRARTLHAGEFGLSVRQAYWSAGIGTRMLEAMIEWARGNGVTRKIKLRVNANNERAIALYHRLGFVDEGVLRRELRVGTEWVDVVMMALWLDESA